MLASLQASLTQGHLFIIMQPIFGLNSFNRQKIETSCVLEKNFCKTSNHEY
jgi:hypothetical protein